MDACDHTMPGCRFIPRAIGRGKGFVCIEFDDEEPAVQFERVFKDRIRAGVRETPLSANCREVTEAKAI